ncbi:MAG: hypothetical protein J6Z44_04870 [Bacteroidales bacterium]|nr:hypothetical protein [Bacteroidales bacterium]
MVMERPYAIGISERCHRLHPVTCPAGTGRGFRRSLRSQRNGGGRRREQGEMGGEGKDSSNGTPQPAAHLPLLFLACGAPFRETRQR